MRKYVVGLEVYHPFVSFLSSIGLSPIHAVSFLCSIGVSQLLAVSFPYSIGLLTFLAVFSFVYMNIPHHGTVTTVDTRRVLGLSRKHPF